MSSSGSSADDLSANGGGFPAPGGRESREREVAGHGLPLLDLTVLRQLEEELGDSGVARSFVRDYIGIWESRIQYLIRSVADDDSEAAMDAVLSLKSSSTMVGGVRLAQLAGELEEAVRDGNMARAQSLLDDVAQRGSETVDELQSGYVLRNSPTPRHP